MKSTILKVAVWPVDPFSKLLRKLLVFFCVLFKQQMQYLKYFLSFSLAFISCCPYFIFWIKTVIRLYDPKIFYFFQFWNTTLFSSSLENVSQDNNTNFLRNVWIQISLSKMLNNTDDNPENTTAFHRSSCNFNGIVRYSRLSLEWVYLFLVIGFSTFFSLCICLCLCSTLRGSFLTLISFLCFTLYFFPATSIFFFLFLFLDVVYEF